MTSTVPTTPLSRAATLPSRYYLDAEILEREKERIFGRTWQLVARTDELQRVGDFVPVTVLDEPVVITHGLDGELRAFYNVCRHRAGQVALTRGNRKSLQCRYHGWTYGLDGTPARVPGDGGDRGLPQGGLRPGAGARGALGPVRVRQPLDASAPPLAEMMGAIPSEVAAAGYDVDNMRLVERRDYVIECNWKVYVDNYLEGYHLPIAHPQLFKELDYDSYRVEEFRYYSKQHAPIRELKPGEELGVDRRYLRQPGAEDSALYYWLFPNTMFNIYQDNMSSNVILPLGPDRTLTDLRVVLRRARQRSRVGVDAADDRLLRRDPAGGHRHLRAGPARPALPRLRLRPLLRQARERRLPLPEPRPRVPRGVGRALPASPIGNASGFAPTGRLRMRTPSRRAANRRGFAPGVVRAPICPFGLRRPRVTVTP